MKKTIWNVIWTAGLSGSVRMVSFGRIAILARILQPSQFGVFGVITIALTFLEMITETGINVFLLQEKGKWEKYIDTAWVVSMLRGAVIAVVMVFVSPLVASYFRIQEYQWLIALAAVIPLVRGFINPSLIRFQKELQFNREFFFRLSIVLLEVGVTAYLAMVTRSVVSLVGGLIASAVFEVVLSWILFLPKPRLKISILQAQEVINRGKWVTGFGIFDFLYTTLDNMVVGRILGSASLGFYQNAYKLATLPIFQMSDVYYKVSMPTFSQMLKDGRETLSVAIKSALLLAGFYVVIGSLVVIWAETWVRLLLGNNWLTIVPVVQVVAMAATLRGISFVFNAFFVANHLQKKVAVVNFVSVVGLGLSVVPLVTTYGLVGAGIAALVGSLVSLPVSALFVFRLIKGKM